jgi:Concanavalin A-like lectin/glucanases superfamily
MTGAGFVVPAAVAGGDPSSVSSATLELWIKADASITTTGGLTDGDRVTAWLDNSTQAHDPTIVWVTTPTDAAPIYKTSQLNGLPAVYFAGFVPGGGTAYLQWSSGFATGYTAGHVFIIVKKDNDPPGGTNDAGLWSFGALDVDGLYPYTDGTIYEGFGSTARKTIGDPTPSLASWNLYEVRSAPSSHHAYINGTEVGTGTSTNTVSFPTNLYLGRAGLDGTIKLSGGIVEMCFYNGVLSAPDIATVKAYFHTRTGLTIV